MTNINCSEKCVYQQDGKCMLDSVGVSMENKKETHGVSSCVYFTKPDASTKPDSTVI